MGGEKEESKATAPGKPGSSSLKKPFKVGAVEFAPIDVPFHRRRQTCGVLFWLGIQLCCVILSFILIRSSGITLVLFVLYVGWMLLFQDFHITGGRASKAFRSIPPWKWFRDYFPIRLEKTAEIPADRPYIFGYHPHGIIGLGAFCNFATEATGFSKLFPGINLRLLTLRVNFRIPFFGLYLTLLGVCDASAESINYILGKGNGNSVMLVLGGAKEALDARPGVYALTLKSRKGFVKLALKHGAALVPVFSFGENDAWQQIPNEKGSFVRKLQETLQAKLGFSMPLIQGRGIFTYNFGILPFRVPITSVVGEPIICPKCSDEEIDSGDLVNKYHALYLAALSKLFDENKGKFDKHGEDAILEFAH